jgi:membrane-bound transcription factor site-1 protease
VRVHVREAGRQLPQSPASVSELLIPFRVAVIAPPPRARRVLFDQFHSLRYPSGYFPRDNLDVKNDMLDWNGDHLHTNFRQLFVAMRQRGYFVDVLGRDFTCFDARLYGTFMIVDPEDEFAAVERAKLVHDVHARGMSLIVFADWFNVDIMQTLRFYDENTRSHWTPVTGGANLPALNELLAPFGVAFGARVFRGELSLGVAKPKGKPLASPFRTYYASGSSLIRFPAGGTMVRASLTEVGSSGSSDRSSTVPIVGWAQTAHHDVPEEAAHSNQSSVRLPSSSSSQQGGGGRIAVFGDSNCIDSSHQVAPCWDLALALLAYASDGVIDAGAFGGASVNDADWTDSNALWPQRPPNSAFARYSNVLPRNGTAQCPVPGSIGEPTGSGAERGAVGALQDPLLRRRGRLPTHAGRVAHGLSGAEVAAADSHPPQRQSVDAMLADERAWRAEWLATASAALLDPPGSPAEVANNGACQKIEFVCTSTKHVFFVVIY